MGHLSVSPFNFLHARARVHTHTHTLARTHTQPHVGASQPFGYDSAGTVTARPPVRALPPGGALAPPGAQRLGPTPGSVNRLAAGPFSLSVNWLWVDQSIGCGPVFFISELAVGRSINRLRGRSVDLSIGRTQTHRRHASAIPTDPPSGYIYIDIRIHPRRTCRLRPRRTCRPRPRHTCRPRPRRSFHLRPRRSCRLRCIAVPSRTAPAPLHSHVGKTG